MSLETPIIKRIPLDMRYIIEVAIVTVYFMSYFHLMHERYGNEKSVFSSFCISSEVVLIWCFEHKCKGVEHTCS